MTRPHTDDAIHSLDDLWSAFNEITEGYLNDARGRQAVEIYAAALLVVLLGRANLREPEAVKARAIETLAELEAALDARTGQLKAAPRPGGRVGARRRL